MERQKGQSPGVCLHPNLGTALLLEAEHRRDPPFPRGKEILGGIVMKKHFSTKQK